jgi:hypothetical protein
MNLRMSLVPVCVLLERARRLEDRSIVSCPGDEL